VPEDVVFRVLGEMPRAPLDALTTDLASA